MSKLDDELLKNYLKIIKEKIKNKYQIDEKRIIITNKLFPYIKFKQNSGLCLSELETLFKIIPSEIKFSGSKKYINFYIKQETTMIPISFFIDNEINKNEFTPQNLGIYGNWSNYICFKDEFLKKCLEKNYSEKIINYLISVIDSIGTGKFLGDYLLLEEENKNIFPSFSEIVSICFSLKNNHNINIPKSSNFMIYDYYEDDIPVSVKSENTDIKINLKTFKNKISKEADLGQLFYGLASNNKELIFKSASKICPVIKKIIDFIGGYSEESFQKFVENHTYSEFFYFIKTITNLGIPKKNGNELWINQSKKYNIYPIQFCLMTILCNFSKLNGIDELVKTFIPNGKIHKVKIKNGISTIKSIEMNSIKHYGLSYWSNAGNPFNNFPALKVIGNL